MCVCLVVEERRPTRNSPDAARMHRKKTRRMRGVHQIIRTQQPLARNMPTDLIRRKGRSHGGTVGLFVACWMSQPHTTVYLRNGSAAVRAATSGYELHIKRASSLRSVEEQTESLVRRQRGLVRRQRGLVRRRQRPGEEETERPDEEETERPHEEEIERPGDEQTERPGEEIEAW